MYSLCPGKRLLCLPQEVKETLKVLFPSVWQVFTKKYWCKPILVIARKNFRVFPERGDLFPDGTVTSFHWKIKAGLE